MKLKNKKVILEKTVGPFNIRITPQRVDIEADKKQWKMVFGKESYEYSMILTALRTGEDRDERIVDQALKMVYGSRMVFQDANFFRMMRDTINTHFESIKEKASDNDDMILAEDRAIHEQDQESIEKLEKLKEDA